MYRECTQIVFNLLMIRLAGRPKSWFQTKDVYGLLGKEYIYEIAKLDNMLFEFLQTNKSIHLWIYIPPGLYGDNILPVSIG